MSQLYSILDYFKNLFGSLEISHTPRQYKGFWGIFIKIFAASFSLFFIVAAVYGSLNPSIIRGFLVLYVLIMVLIKYPFGKKSPMHRPSLVDSIFIGLSIAAIGNFSLNYDDMALRAGIPSFGDVFWGVVTIIIGLEVCRRAMSFILSTVACFFMLYAFCGPYFPGMFSHPGFLFNTVIADIYSNMEGIFGIVCYVFATYVVIFVILSAFLSETGADKFFIDFPVALAAKLRGGAAKAVVFTSLLFGMVSGSSVANTVATGAFTIPLMKKTGYRPEVAAAIEPAVDIGGAFMPPIMGAAVFIMAEMMNIPYYKLCLVALVPALIYFFSTLVMIHFEALKNDIGLVPKELRTPALPILYKSWYYVFPLVILFYLVFSGRSPGLSGFWAIITCFGVGFIENLIKGNFKKTFSQILTALVKGADGFLNIGATVVPIGIIMAVVILTGLAFKFSSIVLSYTYGFKWAALFLVMFATFVVGMGITSTADYLIIATLSVPAMGEMGIPLVAAHLSVYWYCHSCTVTPPVCTSVFAASAIAGTHPYKTALPAMRFSAYMYIMPFTFVYTSMLMPEGFSSDVLITWTASLLSTIPFAAGMVGYFFGHLNPFQRLIMLVAAAFLVFPGTLTSLAGFLLFAFVATGRYLAKHAK